uniref:Ig-like domain-containing protein n=1 Tax=Phlebotomus papatasi TaxID=29031 RepID=A0A1B0DHI0_PHLPP
MNYGETVQAQCTISGGDLPVNVTWYYNGLPLETYLGVYTEKRGNRINNLMIDSVVGKHMGNYTCVAVNRAGIVQHSAELRGPAVMGQDLTLTCSVPDGDLPIDIQWYFNGHAIMDTDDISMMK